MKKLIIANWKANPSTTKEAEELFHYVCDACGDLSDKIDLVVCPPFVYLEPLSKIKSNVRLGAQDVFWENSGPYTGEITPDMLNSLGAGYALVGHSERRYTLGESDEIINKKIKAALNAGITPVLLIGEKEGSRNDIIEGQMSVALEGLEPDQVTRIIFAYEPVWAVSTTPNSRPDMPDNTIDALGVIKNFIYSKFRLKPDGYKFIYGGSIDQDNVASYLIHNEISGAAIGGASLRREEFANILKIVAGLRG